MRSRSLLKASDCSGPHNHGWFLCVILRIGSVIVDSLPSAVTLQELLLASECDPTLKTIKEALDTGNWSAAPKPFADLKDELCQKHGIILRNNRIVIPDALRPRILQLAHEGHQGITKVKQHLRQRVW